MSPELLQRYYEHRFQGMVDLYRYCYELGHNGDLPGDRVMVLPYDLLRTDPKTGFARIEAFTGLEVSAAQRQAVAERSQRQQEYQRRHQVKALADFGLSHERISREFAFAWHGLEDRWE